MAILPKPYLIQPVLVPQPTWGGTYIAETKGWTSYPDLAEVKIGQSYELYGKSAVFGAITDSSDLRFTPYIQGKSSPSPLTIPLADLVREDASAMMGPEIAKRYREIPVLIKFTQALGNSFQLHVRPDAKAPTWKPKAESWYFFEPGKITYGINPARKVEDYEHACRAIDGYMQKLSRAVRTGMITLDEAKAKSKERISVIAPWQYVNVIETETDDVIDLSSGGLHHSWENDERPGSRGNIVYEVQQDVEDEFCTLRSFDQGKFLPDGSIRPIHIDEYFRYLDRDPVKNSVSFAKKSPQGETLIDTPHYSLRRYVVMERTVRKTVRSFHHLFVREGGIEVENSGYSVCAGTGHSVFVPYCAGTYRVIPHGCTSAVVLETDIDSVG